MRKTQVGGIAVAGVVLCLAAGSGAYAGDTMKQLAAAVALPGDTGARELTGLLYKTSAWAAGVRSIRLQEMPAEGAKEVTWILGTTNTRSGFQRVEVDVFLLDGQDARVATGHLSGVLSNAEQAEQKVKMKLPAGSWSAAKTVRVEIRFKAK